MCERCGRTNVNHWFLHQVSDESWMFGIRDIWLCSRCIEVSEEVLGFVDKECLNSMEVCRLINGFETCDFKECFSKQKFGATRPERCNYKARECSFWSFTIYNALRKLEKKGKVQSIKCRFWDRTPMQSDLFRFWFTKEESFHNRISRQRLDAYI